MAKFFGMIANIDDNVGKLMERLAAAGLDTNTVVIFLTDNGPGDVRFNSGLRNRKGTVYEGGTRVPCYVRWPGRVPAGRVVDVPLAHIDIAPTLLAAVGPAVDERPMGTVEDVGTSDAPVGDTVFPGNGAEPLRVRLVGRRRWRIRRPHDAEG